MSQFSVKKFTGFSFHNLAKLRSGSAMSAITMAALVLPASALAQNECGIPDPSDGTVTCDTDGNPYPNGIAYIAPLEDLAIVLVDGVVIDTTDSLNPGVLALAIGANDLTVSGGTNTSITSAAQGAFGVIGATSDGALILSLDEIATTGDNATGISASSGTGSVTANANSIMTAGDNASGITVNTNSGDVTVNSGEITTSGLSSRGVDVLSNLGTISITADTIATTGGSAGFIDPGAIGILANTGGAGGINIDAGEVTTSGEGATGIAAQTLNGLVSITAEAVETSGAAADGINVNSASGLVSADVGTIMTTGPNARGIVATGADGVDIAFDSIMTTGPGATGLVIPASPGPFGPIPTATAAIVGGDITTSGESSDGVFASTTDGDLSYSGENVTVTGSDSTAVVLSSQAGDVSVTTTGLVGASGREGGGIFATSITGDAFVSVNDVSTVAALAGDTDSNRAAIYVSGASADVIVGGSAITTGAAPGSMNAASVTAIATNGDASAMVNNVSAAGDGIGALHVTAANNAAATLNGQLQSLGSDADAVRVTGGNFAAVTVGINGTVSAADGDAIVLTSGNGSRLNNAGAIENNDSGFAVAAFGGSLTINNTGSLTSDLMFTPGNDTVNNSGTFVVGPNPDFGAGADVFVNTGTVRFLAGADAPVARVLTGLETFNNSGGLIDLRNDVAGDELTLPGAFIGSANSMVGVDVNLSSDDQSDRLNIGGAATGSTSLLVELTGPAALNSGTILVQGGAGTLADAFVLAGGSQSFGLIETDLVFDPVGNSFSLVGAPGAAAYRTAGFVDAARNLWYESADAWSAHMRELRDGAWGSGAGSASGGLWVQMHGSLEEQDNITQTSTFGLARTFDLGFQQDYFGGQAGFDFGGKAGDDGNFAFGVTGGYINSHLKFSGVTDEVAFDAFNGGAYATINSGSLFISVLGKYDYYKANSESQSGQYVADIDGDAYGAQAEIGFRIGSDNFFIEPVGTIAYVRTNLDDLVVQASTIEFIDDDGLRGKLGARLGASFPSAMLNTVVLYAGGNYVHEFRGEDSVDFTNGNELVRITNRPRGDYGEAVLGVNIGATDAVSGFIEANGAMGTDFEAYGARAGLRFRF